MAVTFNILSRLKNSRNLLLYFKEIRCYNLQELLLGLKKCISTSFVALGMHSEINIPKTGEPTVGSFLTIMLQHTGRFRSRIS